MKEEKIIEKIKNLFDLAGNKGRQSPNLSSGTETEKVAGFLILPDLLYRNLRELIFIRSLVEIQSTVEITGKYFFLHNHFPSC